MAPVRFPPGEIIFLGKQFDESIFAEIDKLLAAKRCAEGSFDIETPYARLTCLIHNGLPHVAGLQEQDSFAWVPLKEFPVRARQLPGATCSLTQTDPFRVLLAAVHFRNRPVLQASTEMVVLAHILDQLAQKGQDAALALERFGTRTVVFFLKGLPVKLYFGNPAEDKGGVDIRDRLLTFAQSATIGAAKIELFERLNIFPDPEAGASFVQLDEAARPPPTTILQVRSEGRLLFQQPFVPPSMVFGRDHTCELLLDNMSVSRRHARLSWERGQFWVEDLESANGTKLKGRVITRSSLNLGELLSMGSFTISLFAPLDEDNPNATVMMTPESTAQGYLVSHKLTVPVRQELTIGRAPAVDVQVRGWGIKPVHARIRREGQASYRLDCFGKARVTLNDKKVVSAHLRFGDKICIGKSIFYLVSKA
jgi:pSer/pThr/pTyr-binding forkhead associated (FHA) protein